MQGDVSPGDMIYGATVLAVALPVLYGIGRIVGRVKNGRFERAWRPLLATIDGAEVVADRGGGAASSWLTGTYRGAAVFAHMTPDVRHGGQIHTVGLENRWEAGVRDLPGARDWSVRWSDSVLGIGTTGWTVRADDAALAAGLERAGVREIAAPLGRGTIEYRARPATLVLHQDIRPLRVPAPARFRQELDVLLELAAVVAPLNRG